MKVLCSSGNNRNQTATQLPSRRSPSLPGHLLLATPPPCGNRDPALLPEPEHHLASSVLPQCSEACSQANFTCSHSSKLNVLISVFLSLGRLKRTLCPGLVTAHASVSPRALDLCTCTSGAAWRVRGRRAHLAQQGMDESSLWAACSQDGSARVDTVGLGVMEGKPAS